MIKDKEDPGTAADPLLIIDAYFGGAMPLYTEKEIREKFLILLNTLNGSPEQSR